MTRNPDFSCRFDHRLADRVRARLAEFRVRRIEPGSRRRAAVALTLVEYDRAARIGNITFDPAYRGDAAYVLTTRTARLSSHAGQRAFPGGSIDSGESAVQAALRELEEEVGLRLGEDSVLGRLDDYATRSGFVISPFVVWGGKAENMKPNPEEVESIHRVPLRELLRDDAPILEPIPESEHPVLKMPLGDDWVAAPSAAIAYQFREVALFGRHTRVAHFEQPYFAWA